MSVASPPRPPTAQGAPTHTALALTEITLDDRAWPRASIDHERVVIFMELLSDAAQQSGAWIDPLPPLVVVPDGLGGYVLADGRHRHEARRRLGKGFHRVAVHVHASNGSSPVDHAYALALMYTTRSARPLTSAEKRAAIRRLIAEHPAMSNRQIARFVGVTHPTVAVQRSGMEAPTEATEPPERPDPLETIAKKLNGLLASCRNMTDNTDLTAAGGELYGALVRVYGTERADALLSDFITLTESAVDCAIQREPVT